MSSAARHRDISGALALAAVLALALILFLPSPASALQAHDYKMAGEATQMRVVMNFDGEPDPRWFLLRSPHRLVIDLPKTRFALDPKAVEAVTSVDSTGTGSVPVDPVEPPRGLPVPPPLEEGGAS